MRRPSFRDVPSIAPSRRQLIVSACAWAATAGAGIAATAARDGDKVPPSAQVVGTAPWMTLPPTPPLPTPTASATQPINGTPIFYARFGSADATGTPVILLHGGMGNSNYWGHQIAHLADRRRVVAMDTRGHGRSPLIEPVLDYGLFAEDVAALMDALVIPKASIVGWSDGAITGLELAMRHPERVDRLFAFGGNVSRHDMRHCTGACPTFVGYVLRCRTEYESLSPDPDKWPDLMSGLRAMWRRQGAFSDAELARISADTIIADGAHDEIIKPSQPADLARQIRGARALTLPNTSHFAMLQDPAGFNTALDRFLA